MNKLTIDRQAQVIKVLCEGNSIRSTARITDTAVNTVVKLLKEVGKACLEYQDRNLRHLPCKRIECDEIWNFCHSKEKNVSEENKGKLGYGDVWTFVGIEAETKLIVSWRIGGREPEDAYEFVSDIKARVENRIQLNTDGHKMYFYAVDQAFKNTEIDFAMIVKHYGTPLDIPQGHYSPGTVRNVTTKKIRGNPDMTKVSTSYVERQNLNIRMGMRRFTRLTNGFSKKIENQVYATALYFMFFNFARAHRTLSNPYPKTPAMAIGLSDHIWSFEEIVKLIHPGNEST